MFFSNKIIKKRNVFKHVTKCKNLIFANICHSRFDFHFDFNSIEAPLCNILKPVFVNVYGAQESIPRNRFRQPM
jgi:hypothetical protein